MLNFILYAQHTLAPPRDAVCPRHGFCFSVQRDYVAWHHVPSPRILLLLPTWTRNVSTTLPKSGGILPTSRRLILVPGI